MDALRSQANYGSAVGAGNPAYYARKDATTKPVILLLGPVHGQEVEGIVGLVNLIHVAETGQDHRGRAWPRLAQLSGELSGRDRALRQPRRACSMPLRQLRRPSDAHDDEVRSGHETAMAHPGAGPAPSHSTP